MNKSNGQRGLFITLEGTEGVGKSTNIRFIEQQLRQAGIELVLTREPGGTPLAEEIRTLLLAEREEPFDALAELLMIFAARSQHLHTMIEPHLARGHWVLSDRFTDATFAYQGYGRGLSLEAIALLEKLVQGECQPDKTIYLDIDVATGLARAGRRGILDRFEQEEQEFFERVRQGYLSRIKENPQRYYLVNASQNLNDVQKDLMKIIKKLTSL